MNIFYFINTIIIFILSLLALKLIFEYKISFRSSSKNINNKPKFGFISTSEVYNVLFRSKEEDFYIIIDIRDEKEYSRGHIKNAINIPIKAFKGSSLLKDLNKSESYIICGQRHSSAQKAMDMMQILRFLRVHCMTGGMIEWNLQGYPTEK
jgi:rhodanese-related sulfurtransferase